MPNKSMNPLIGKVFFDDEYNLQIHNTVAFGAGMKPAVNTREWLYLAYLALLESQPTFEKEKKTKAIARRLKPPRSTEYRLRQSLIKKGYVEGEVAEIEASVAVTVIDAFSVVNPANDKWYKMRYYREACDRIVKKHGLEKVLAVVKILPKTNRITHVPIVTTPIELEDKWAKLESALVRKKAEMTEKKPDNLVVDFTNKNVLHNQIER
jgi:hypothetical protein